MEFKNSKNLKNVNEQESPYNAYDEEVHNNEKLNESDLLIKNDCDFSNNKNFYKNNSLDKVIETIESKINSNTKNSEIVIKIENPQEIKNLCKQGKKRYQQCFKIKAINVPSKTDLIEKIETFIKDCFKKYEKNNEIILIKDSDFIIEYFEDSISFIFINKNKAVEFYKFLQKVKNKTITEYYKMDLIFVFGLEARESLYKLIENSKCEKFYGNSSLAANLDEGKKNKEEKINEKNELLNSKLKEQGSVSKDKKLNDEKLKKLSSLMITEIPIKDNKIINQPENILENISENGKNCKRIDTAKLSSYKSYFNNSRRLVNNNSTNYNLKNTHNNLNDDNYNSNNSINSQNNNIYKKTNNSFKINYKNEIKNIICRKTTSKNYIDESVEKFYMRSLKRISDKKFHMFNEEDIKSNHVNNINFSNNEKKNFAIKQSRIYNKQEEILKKINPSFNSISSPYVNNIDLERIEEINLKEKFIDKQGFNLSLTKNYLGKIIKPLDNYVNLTPSDPPVLHKFRSTNKNLWMSSEGFKP